MFSDYECGFNAEEAHIPPSDYQQMSLNESTEGESNLEDPREKQFLQ